MSGIFWKRGRKNCQSDPETDKYTRCLSRIPNSTSSQKHVCTRILQNPTNLWDGDGNELCVLVNESSNLSASLMLFSFLPAPPPWRRAQPICAVCWKHFPEDNNLPCYGGANDKEGISSNRLVLLYLCLGTVDQRTEVQMTQKYLRNEIMYVTRQRTTVRNSG